MAETMLPIAPGGPAFALPQFTSVLAEPEDVYQITYDRQNYPAAGQFETFFFSNPLGASVTLIRGTSTATVQKTRRDTNLEQQGVLPAKWLDIRGFSIHLVGVQHAIGGANTPKIGDDYWIFYEGSFLEFRVVDKPRMYMPLIAFRSLDPVNMAGTPATNGIMVSSAGVGAQVYWFETSPIVIPMNVNFSCRIQSDGSPAVSQTMDVYVIAHGFHRRPKQ